MTFRSDNLEPVPSGFCEHRILAAICRLCPADAGTWTAADPLTVTGDEDCLCCPRDSGERWEDAYWEKARRVAIGPLLLLAFALGLALGWIAGGAR